MFMWLMLSHYCHFRHKVTTVSLVLSNSLPKLWFHSWFCNWCSLQYFKKSLNFRILKSDIMIYITNSMWLACSRYMSKFNQSKKYVGFCLTLYNSFEFNPLQNIWQCVFKMKYKKYHTNRTVPKSNRKFMHIKGKSYDQIS
jgi:hypothetical protein